MHLNISYLYSRFESDCNAREGLENQINAVGMEGGEKMWRRRVWMERQSWADHVVEKEWEISLDNKLCMIELKYVFEQA